MMNKIFRFDDVSINSDIAATNAMASFLIDKFPYCKIIFGISSMVHNIDEEKEKERVFPKILNAYSDFRKFYEVDAVGIPDVISHKNIVLATHGLIHVDHRLLTKEAQEISIIVSQSLVKSKIFIPPFNHWNNDTDTICKEHGIQLIKFEEGWKSLEHNKYQHNEKHNLWYLHARAFTIETFKSWFEL